MSSRSHVPENIYKSSFGCKVAPRGSGHFESSKNYYTKAKLMTTRADLPNFMEPKEMFNCPNISQVISELF